MYDKFSRYAGSEPSRTSDGLVWLPGRPRVEKKDYQDNNIHVTIQGEDCQLLAWMYLEDERFWWVIADMNNIFNALYTFQGGEELIIPSIRTLYEEILPTVTRG